MPKRSKVVLYEQIRKAHERDGVSVHELARRFRVHRRSVREALASPVPPERRVATKDAPVLGPWKATIDGWLEADHGPAQAAPHGPAGLAAPGRRTRRGRGRVHRAGLRGRGPPAHGGAPGRGDGAPAPPPGRGGRGRLRDLPGGAGRARGGRVDVHHAPVGLGPLLPPGLPERGPGGLPRRPRPGLRALRGRARADPLRQPQGGRRAGAEGPGPHRVGPLRRPALPLRLRQLLLPAGDQGQPREGRGGGRGGPLPAPPPGAGAPGGVDGRAQRAAGGRGCQGRRAPHRPAPPQRGRALRPRGRGAPPAAGGPLRRQRGGEPSRRPQGPGVGAGLHVLRPARFAGRRLDVRLGAETVEVLDGASTVARHPRGLKGDEVLALDHYLEVLAIKTGALPGATALARARACGAFGPVHERFWAEARRRLGDHDGTRALIEVLLLHRSVATGAVLTGIDRALGAGSIDPAVVAIEARRGAESTGAPVVPIGEGLSRFDRPAPSIADYDDLLEA